MGRPLIYLDANVVIRLVEGDATARAPLVARLGPSLGVPGSLVTSRLTRLECQSKPLRSGDLATLAQFDVFFAGVELVVAAQDLQYVVAQSFVGGQAGNGVHGEREVSGAIAAPG